MICRLRAVLVLVFSLVGMVGAASAEDVINTDRPGTVESTQVVGPGRWQLETSYALAREGKDSPKVRSYSTPTLLRIGLSDKLELRVETDGLMRESTWSGNAKTTAQGSSDVALGVKWRLRDALSDCESCPSTAWLFHVDTPTGTSDFREQGLRPSARYVAEWDWGIWSLGVMPGIYVGHNDENKRYLGGIFAVSLGAQLNDRAHTFIEFSGDQLTSPKNGGNSVSIDTGLAYLLTNQVQVDVSFVKGVSKAAPKQQWAVGLSFMY